MSWPILIFAWVICGAKIAHLFIVCNHFIVFQPTIIKTGQTIMLRGVEVELEQE
jgi:hypothetical protein